MNGSDNAFLKMPHIFKPMQTLNAIILAICIGSTAGSENALIWFVVIFSLLVSAAATVILAMGIQDQLMESISNGQVAWNAVELAYSFLFSVLSVLGIWLSFSLSGYHVGGSSAGYIAAGLFFVVHTGLYGVPCYFLYNEVQSQRREAETIEVRRAHPFSETPYQDL